MRTQAADTGRHTGQSDRAPGGGHRLRQVHAGAPVHPGGLLGCVLQSCSGVCPKEGTADPTPSLQPCMLLPCPSAGLAAQQRDCSTASGSLQAGFVLPQHCGHITKGLAAGRGEACRIVVAQPRRISAVSLATRVAAERSAPLGDDVGYTIRLENK